MGWSEWGSVGECETRALDVNVGHIRSTREDERYEMVG